jgi:hypothetical protein
VHGYWSIDLEILHTTATEQLPSFASDVRAVQETLAADIEDTPAAGPSDANPVGVAGEQGAAPTHPSKDTPTA